MKLSEYKEFYNQKCSLDLACLVYLNSVNMKATKARIVDIYEKFLIVAYEADHGEEIISISIWNIITDKPPGCASCK